MRAGVAFPGRKQCHNFAESPGRLEKAQSPGFGSVWRFLAGELLGRLDDDQIALGRATRVVECGLILGRGIAGLGILDGFDQ